MTDGRDRLFQTTYGRRLAHRTCSTEFPGFYGQTTGDANTNPFEVGLSIPRCVWGASGKRALVLPLAGHREVKGRGYRHHDPVASAVTVGETSLRKREGPTMPIIDRIAQFHGDLTSWRRDIHAHPEL